MKGSKMHHIIYNRIDTHTEESLKTHLDASPNYSFSFKGSNKPRKFPYGYKEWSNIQSTRNKTKTCCVQLQAHQEKQKCEITGGEVP